MLGVNLTSRDVKECNKRGCFHIHGQAQGGATPELIAFVAEDARLRSRLLEALDTQLQARRLYIIGDAREGPHVTR